MTSGQRNGRHAADRRARGRERACAFRESSRAGASDHRSDRRGERAAEAAEEIGEASDRRGEDDLLHPVIGHREGRRSRRTRRGEEREKSDIEREDLASRARASDEHVVGTEAGRGEREPEEEEERAGGEEDGWRE